MEKWTGVKKRGFSAHSKQSRAGWDGIAMVVILIRLVRNKADLRISAASKWTDCDSQFWIKKAI